jgi:hypothetical protein
MSGERASEFWTFWIGMGFLGLLDIHREHTGYQRRKTGPFVYSLVSALLGTIASMSTNTTSSLWISRHMEFMDNKSCDSREMIPRCGDHARGVRAFEKLQNVRSHTGMCSPIPRNTDCPDITHSAAHR